MPQFSIYMIFAQSFLPILHSVDAQAKDKSFVKMSLSHLVKIKVNIW